MRRRTALERSEIYEFAQPIRTAVRTSVTFIAFPGAAYAKDWSLLIPGFFLLVVIAMVGTVIIPFYRHTVGMSAFEYFGKRFGRPTRVYASVAFTLAHFSKMGLVFTCWPSPSTAPRAGIWTR